MTLVVDASVAFKWFVTEPDSAEALAVRRSDPDLVAPHEVVSEVCNSAWKSLRRGQLTAAQCAAIAADIGRSFARLAAHDALAPRALAIALDLDHPAYDCFYLALAERERTVVVTADRRLVAKVAQTPYAGLVRLLAADVPP